MATSHEPLMKRLLPHVDYHQNKYAKVLGEAVADDEQLRWLDIGAGTQLHGGWEGASQTELAAHASMFVGCDLVVDHLRDYAVLTAAVGADASALPFRSGSFDLVTANMVLEHLEEPEKVFSEISRVLAPGGRFVFLTPSAGHPVVFLFSFLPRRLRRWVGAKVEGRPEEHVFPTYYRANTTRRLRSLAGAAGFTVEVLEPFPSYLMTMRKALLFFLVEAAVVSLSRGPLRGLSSNLVGTFRRTSGSNDAAATAPVSSGGDGRLGLQASRLER